MTDTGLDYAFPPRPDLDAVWAQGYRFVLRYLAYRPNSKCIDAPELADLLYRGFEVALNWEQGAQDALGGAAKGKQQANEAVRQAQALGYPAGCTLYFSATDFDATPAQLAGPVADYYRAAGQVVHAAGYRIGDYGGIKTVAYLLDHGLIDDGWQTYAWSGGHWDPRAAVRQDKNGIIVGGADCDHNTRVGTTYFMHPAGQSTQEDDMRLVAAPDGTIWLLDGCVDEHGKPYIWAPTYAAVQQYELAGVPTTKASANLDLSFFHRMPDGSTPGGGGIPPHTHDLPSTTGPVASPAQPAA